LSKMACPERESADEFSTGKWFASTKGIDGQQSRRVRS
jgi:hypothetical protein